MNRRPERKGFDKLLYDQHVERIRSMKGTVDNKPPRPHPLSNKSEIDKRRKFAAIEYDNRLLLERLAKIVQKKTIDNQVQDSIQMQKTFKAKLSMTKKKLEAQKITQENRRILQRIQEIPPVYNHIEWEVAAKERADTIKHMLHYPEYFEKRLEESKESKSLKKLMPQPLDLESLNEQLRQAKVFTSNNNLSKYNSRAFTAPSILSRPNTNRGGDV